MQSRRNILCAGLFAFLLSACATTEPPAVTHDGLELAKHDRNLEVYKKPGMDLGHYDEYGLLPCQVAFRKNWLRDQNRNSLDLSQRVTQKDVDRIKDFLSAECDKHFRRALEEPPPYKLVETFTEGEAVVILRPSIINLDVTAPDTMSAGRSRTYTTSSGQMTLFLEGIDATTHETLFRVIDRKQAMDTGFMQWTNAVTNKSDADRALRYWSSRLRAALDKAHGIDSE